MTTKKSYDSTIAQAQHTVVCSVLIEQHIALYYH